MTDTKQANRPVQYRCSIVVIIETVGYY